MYKCGNTRQHNGGPVHAPANLATGGESQVHTEQGSGWAPQLVWIREKLLALREIE
jgi:hypothetical protein